MTRSGRDRLWQLASALVEATDSGRAAWAEAAEAGTFEFTGKAGTVSIGSIDRDGYAPYVVSLVDGNGLVVESVDSRESDSWSGLLHDLYAAARRTALNIDPLVDSLLEEIGVLATHAQADAPPTVKDDLDDLPF